MDMNIYCDFSEGICPECGIKGEKGWISPCVGYFRGLRAKEAKKGPGTELKAILADLGVEPSPSCDCNAKARKMDDWGVAGCKQNRDQIVEWMREGQTRWGWKEKLTAAANAVKIGLAFKLNPLDPFPSLVDEAISRAEEKQAQGTASSTLPSAS